MIGRLVRLGALGGVAAALADRLLAERDAAAGVPPIHSLVVVDAPIERTWQAIADVEGQPRWMHDLKSVELRQQYLKLMPEDFAAARGLASMYEARGEIQKALPLYLQVASRFASDLKFNRHLAELLSKVPPGDKESPCSSTKPAAPWPPRTPPSPWPWPACTRS